MNNKNKEAKDNRRPHPGCVKLPKEIPLPKLKKNTYRANKYEKKIRK
jgi:hypothetical protein